MSHKHEYETIERHAVTKEAEAIGIRSAETRRCGSCGEESIFLLSGENWVQLYDRTTRDEKDILLA